MAFNSYKEDEKVSVVPKKVTIKRLLSYLLDYKKELLVVFLVLAYGTAVDLVNPLLLEKAVDDYLVPKDYKGLFILIGIALVLNTLWVILVKQRMKLMGRVSNRVVLKIREMVFTNLQRLELTYFDTRPAGKILSRVMDDVNSLKNVLEQFVLTLLPNLVTVIAVMVIMLVKSSKLALAGMCGFPILIVGIAIIEKINRVRWRDNRKKASNLNAFIHEDVSGIRIVKTFAAEDETLATFDELNEATRDSFIRAVRVSDMFFPLINITQAMSIALMFYVGVTVIGWQNLSTGLIMAFISYIAMFWQPISNLGSFYNQIIRSLAAAERVFEVIDTEPAIKDAADAGELPEIKGEVRFDHVTFAYEDDIDVLKDVSFDVKPGETIALVGPTGAGKTTIINLLSRFYDVKAGRVLIDGTDVKSVTIESLRSQLGIMTQDNFLFTGTIRDNIRYGKLDATDEEIERAAKAVNAHEFITKLEKGYDTELAERGGGLSIGQKQLIAFARTILSDPKILILDEATSSIDTKNELMVQAGIDAILKNRTSFVIAHRLSTIRHANRIFVVRDGGIAEEGNHETLMAQHGLYYDLQMAQQQ